MSTIVTNEIRGVNDVGVLQPTKPSFFAHMTGGTWVDNVADDTVLPFNTTLHNIGNHYSTSTYKFTVPIAGVYFFAFQLYLSNGGGAQYAGIGKNGSLLNTGNGDNYPLIGIYQSTISYYKKKFPKRILEVDLNELTSNSVKTSQDVFKFCGLNWNEEILNFYKRKDLFSKTISSSQIRKQISQTNQSKYDKYYFLLDKV